jgi:hypothetical protein
MRKMILGFLLFTVLAAGQTQDYQQYVPRFSDGPAQYVLGQGDMLTITVNLWGYVRKPGIYTIPTSYGLIDLMSSAGGPAENSSLSDIRIIRRDQAVLTVDVERFLKTGNKDLIPPLEPGDVVIVSGSVINVFSQVLGWARDIAIILNVFLLVQALNR